MNNTSSSEQLSETGNLDAILLLSQKKLDLKSGLMEIKSVNPKFRQNQLAREVGYSISPLQRYRHVIKIQSPYKPNGSKRSQKTASDLKRPQKTSKEHVIIDSTDQAHSLKPITNKEVI